MRRRCSKRWCWRPALRMRYHCPKHLSPPEAWDDLVDQINRTGDVQMADMRPQGGEPPPWWARRPGESAIHQKCRTGVISGTGPPPTRPPPKAPRSEP